MLRTLTDRVNHEYWPWQVIYLPVVPLYLYQAIRQRRAAFFTNVNPAIDMGGFFGESKSAIYALLPKESFPQTCLIPVHSTEADVIHTHRASGIPFPLIVKPDVGERGQGVVRVTDENGLVRALAGKSSTFLLQAMAPGDLEFGLMFTCDPAGGSTTLLSVAGKDFLSVTGDGRSTVLELLRKQWRGRKQVERLLELDPVLLSTVPLPGVIERVEPIGNHCRGTLFNDANHLRTSVLCEVVDRLLASTEGIYYGRMDVRCESEADLREGRFTIIEMNGVSSEPGHIYDPRYSIFQCWRELVRHVRHVGRISEQLQHAGTEPVSFHDLLGRVGSHLGWRLGPLRRVVSWFA